MDNKISVEIFGETYRLKTDNDPEYMRNLAAKLDKRLREAARASHSLAGHKIGVMVALELADEYYKLKRDYDGLMEMLEDK